MFGFSTEEGKEVVQLAGACFFVHQYVPKSEEREKDDQSEKIIVFCPNQICAKTIATKKQFTSTDNIAAGPVHMKRVTLDPSTWSSDELTVIEVMGADTLEKLMNDEKYSGEADKELQKALIKNDSDWILAMDKWKLKEEFLAGGSYRASTHLGPDDRTFVSIENSNFQAK